MSESKTTSDPLVLALLQDCIDLSKNCSVVQGAFSVGSLLYLPSSSKFFEMLKDNYQKYCKGSDGQVNGLYLSGSWSRHLPATTHVTHAEANALALFREAYETLKKRQGDLPDAGDVLRDAWCVASMEPCSVRTSGGPSCARSLVEAHVARVYLGVQEPPDYVQCQGVRILEEGGVAVYRVHGLEEECLQAARRGL